MPLPRQPTHTAPSALNESTAPNRAPGWLHFHIPMYTVPLIHNVSIVESCKRHINFLEFQLLVGLLVAFLPATACLHFGWPEGPRIHNPVGPGCY